jgi:hypothetical protein
MKKGYMVYIRLLFISLAVILSAFFVALNLLRKKNVIVVYQVGKVASSSVMASLRINNISAIQVHWATSGGIVNLLAEHARYGFKVPRHIINSAALNFLRHLGKKKINYLILTRFPGDRNISAYFQNKYDSYNSMGVDVSHSVELDELYAEFLSRYKHWIPESWLVHDFCVFFDVSPQHLIQKLKQGPSLMLGSSKVVFHSINSHPDTLLGSLNQLIPNGDQLSELVHANLADDKDYSLVYSEMKARISQTDYSEQMNTVSRQFSTINEILLYKKP